MTMFKHHRNILSLWIEYLLFSEWKVKVNKNFLGDVKNTSGDSKKEIIF